MNDHLDRLRPTDGVEFGTVEEMVASRLRPAAGLGMEPACSRTKRQPPVLGSNHGCLCDLTGKPSLGLMHRYQTRLHLNYQRALHNMLLLRVAAVPNEPSPISGQPAIQCEVIESQ